MKNIRNFSIIAHIDHGKSTLADRLLEVTGTIEKRKMRDQVLDQMDLERERGITIKMQPVRMKYKQDGEEYILNLIDTPGHIDFTYEVSRAIKAVEGTILLVDATQGVQAQTLSVLEMAQKQNLKIIPVLNKIDLPVADVEGVGDEVMRLLGCSREDILHVSGKTGEGVEELLRAVVERIPAPVAKHSEQKDLQALVFDFSYSSHRGVIVFARVFEGSIKKGDKIRFANSKRDFIVHSLGIFRPEEVPVEELSAGEIGLIVTGVKEPRVASVGDTLVSVNNPAQALPGYFKPTPVVWASLYPENQDDFPMLKQGLSRLSLSDSSLDYEEETSGTLGRGFRCGFLGMLHLEIITERLRREANLKLIVASPTITYEIEKQNGTKEKVYSAAHFPDDGTYKAVWEPWVAVNIITPPEYVGNITQLFHKHEALAGDVESFGEHRISLHLTMPLRELMHNFFDEVKSASSGYGSLSYSFLPSKLADITRLDVLLADERVIAFSRVVSRMQAQEEAENIVEKLEKILPRQLFELKIQAKAFGRILASRRISAMRKDVTGYLYGGDVTRKMKLLEKQKKGKKRMKETGKVNIPQDVFLKIARSE